MSKITKATFKSFLKKNDGKLYISNKSHFDGMYDCTMPCEDSRFTKLIKADYFHDNNLGYAGVWLVHTSGNSFSTYDKDGFEGIEVYNCCSHFIVAMKK